MSRPELLDGITTKEKTPCGGMYVVINYKEKINEVFSFLGKGGGCPRTFLEALSRVISLAIRSGVDEEKIITTLRGIRCSASSDDLNSCPTAMASALGKFLKRHKVEDSSNKSK